MSEENLREALQLARQFIDRLTERCKATEERLEMMTQAASGACDLAERGQAIVDEAKDMVRAAPLSQYPRLRGLLAAYDATKGKP